METLTTHGIKITVETLYQDAYSKPFESKYIFAYRIKIENKNDFTVQLLRRHWYILDANYNAHEVEGEGVIGQQPILKPGQSHQYTSWTPLQNPLGKMHGTFLMQKEDGRETFKVKIPEFKLIAPFVHN